MYLLWNNYLKIDVIIFFEDLLPVKWIYLYLLYRYYIYIIIRDNKNRFIIPDFIHITSSLYYISYIYVQTCLPLSNRFRLIINGVHKLISAYHCVYMYTQHTSLNLLWADIARAVIPWGTRLLASIVPGVTGDQPADEYSSTRLI